MLIEGHRYSNSFCSKSKKSAEASAIGGILSFKKTWTNPNKRAQTYGLYSQKDTKKFINTIGFNNPKHIQKCLGGVVA